MRGYSEKECPKQCIIHVVGNSIFYIFMSNLIYIKNIMSAEIKDISLKIEINNRNPLELSELTKSLISLSNQYNSFVKKNGFTEEERQAKLFVKEIKSGSVILDLYEVASVGVIPFLEHTNTIIGFAGYLKDAVNYFLKGSGEKPNVTAQDCKDISQIVNPIAGDQGSQFNLSVNNNGEINNYVFLNSNDSNALQNILKKEVKELQEPQTGDVIHNAIMTFYQTRGNVKSKSGNKVIIDDGIKGKPINVVFESPKIKKQILKGDDNPYNFAYQVDVKLKTSDGKIIAYEVIKLHDKFPIDDES